MFVSNMVSSRRTLPSRTVRRSPVFGSTAVVSPHQPFSCNTGMSPRLKSSNVLPRSIASTSAVWMSFTMSNPAERATVNPA